MIRWLRYLHERTNILTKVLVANAAIVLAGGLLGALLAHFAFRGEEPNDLLMALLVLAAIALSVGVNYAILRLAFVPLFVLQETIERVRAGDYHARAPRVGGDPDLERVLETTNLMLDRLQVHRKEVAAQTLRALEEERKRIARELHDETSQALTTLKVNLEAVEQKMGRAPADLRERIRFTKEYTAQTLDEIRRLMFDLRPSMLDDLGLVPALRHLLKERVRGLGLQVDFHVEGLEERLPEDLETALFRVIQEAVTNVIKHARASRVQIVLRVEAGAIVVRVQDDGAGFDPSALSGRDGRGLGLFGMQERTALVGGRLEIDAAPGRGTTVRVWVPYRR
jgi:two-component system, NarL family, sensor histidine kinase UhpB